MGNFRSLDHHMSAFTIYKQNMKGIGYFLDDVEVTYEEHEDYVRGNSGPRCFFCNLARHFKFDCTQFCNAVAISMRCV